MSLFARKGLPLQHLGISSGTKMKGLGGNGGEMFIKSKPVQNHRCSWRNLIRRPVVSGKGWSLIVVLMVMFLTWGKNSEEFALPQTTTALDTKINSVGITLSETTLQQRAAARIKYGNCNISFVPPQPRQQSQWRKPLWVPSFPGSGSASPSKKGDLTKELIDAITGLKQATKNYHMSIKGGALRRCHGMSETAACTQGHPLVPIGPETQTEDFDSRVIFAIRNFATAFPAFHTEKHIAYHGGQGQAPENQWRSIRDEHLESNMKSWRELIQWWRNADYYKVALYLPYEWLLSTVKGPELVQQLANVYSEAGFEVAPPKDIPCIWFQMAEKEWKRQENMMEYIPGYTSKQRDFIVQQLNEQIDQVKDDNSLKPILEEYRDTVMQTTRLE